MMEFIIMTVSFTVAILLAGVIATIAMVAMMLSPKIMKGFSKVMTKYMENLIKINGEDETKDL